MRVAFSAVLDPERPNNPDIHFHCSWWKLPAKPVDFADVIDRDHIVSVAPCTLDSADKEVHVFAARVCKKDQKAVEAQLRECLNAYLPRIAASPQQMAEKIKKWMTSKTTDLRFDLAHLCDVERIIATRVATSLDIGDHMVLAGGPSLKAAFLEQIRKNEHNHPTASDTVFMRTLRESFMPQGNISPLQYRTAERTANYLAVDLKSPA